MNTRQHELLEAVRRWSRILHRHEHGAALARERVRTIIKEMEGEACACADNERPS